MVQKVWNLCWNFSHKFVFQYIMLKLILWIFRDFMGIYWIINTLFFWPRTAAARLGRSTERSTVPSSRSTLAIDRRARIRARWLPHEPIDRTVDRLRAGCSRLESVDRAVDRPESRCSLDLGRSTDRSTGSCQRLKCDRWPVNRAVDR